MGTRKLVWLALAVLLLLAGCADGGSGSGREKKDAQIEKWIAQVSLEEIEVEETVDEDTGTLRVTAQVPDYTQLFLAAMDSDDPDKALRKAIDAGEYDTVEYETEVRRMETEDGAPQSEALVKSFIEEELIKAINAVTEEMEEGE